MLSPEQAQHYINAGFSEPLVDLENFIDDKLKSGRFSFCVPISLRILPKIPQFLDGYRSMGWEIDYVTVDYMLDISFRFKE